MTNAAQNPQLTTSDREDNPKAVFIGDREAVITPIATYMDERHVDLFTGKNVNDAFFGDYFFYVGRLETVKTFLEERGDKLPKTLLLCDPVSVDQELTKVCEKMPHVKLVWLPETGDLNKTQVEEIMGFFFVGDQPVLTLAKAFTSQPNSANETVEEEDVHSNVDEPIETDKDLEVAPVVQDLEATKDTIEEVSVENKALGSEPEKKAEEQPTGEEILKKNAEEIPAELPRQPIEPDDVEKKVKDFFDDAPKQTGNSNKRKPLLPLLFLGALFFLLFPFLTLATETGLALIYFRQAVSATQKGAFTQSERYFKSAQTYANLGVKNSALLIAGVRLFAPGSAVSGTERLFSALAEASDGGAYLTKAAQDGQTLFAGFSGKDKGVAYAQTISSMKGNLTLADSALAQAQAELDSPGSEAFFDLPIAHFFAEDYHRVQNQLVVARQQIGAGRDSASILPEALGLYEEQTFLLLFQNNMELRPTGGFIGSFGLLTLSDGQLKNFQVEDIYTADGALAGHVEPPEPIKAYLEQEHWYMRDSNWDPDFSESAARAAWFLDKELGVSVDGVIAVDLDFAKSLLNVTGPVTLEDYNQEISADNLFEVAHASISENFFPGSTNKRDLLGSLGRKLLAVLLEGEDIHQTQLAAALFQGLAQKHALLYFTSPQAQNVVELLGWGGRIKQENCGSACFSDLSMVVDANLAVNKSNYYISRDIEDDVRIEDSGVITHTLQINYVNESASATDAIGGTYKNYLRVLVPKEAHVVEGYVGAQALTLENAPIASASTLIATPTEQYQELAVWFEVRPQASEQVRLTYVIEPSAPFSQYRYQIYKQPGIETNDVLLEISYPQAWNQPVANQPIGDVAGATTLVKGANLTYNSKLSTDTTFSLRWNK
ncbi:DUF4012 domain-containing protein [Candidatus Microgenomates bacterium]|nr:MAG: DUF4012 domain-containing protein [Candidatus Microgenomates bacterium]